MVLSDVGPVGRCSLLHRWPGERGAAEVFKLVQLSSGSSVYPDRHDVLCLLRAASHDEDRGEPRSRLLRPRLGVLDRTPGLHSGSLRTLRQACAVVHVPVVRGIERVLSASRRRCGRSVVARRPRALCDSPRFVAPMHEPGGPRTAWLMSRGVLLAVTAVATVSGARQPTATSARADLLVAFLRTL